MATSSEKLAESLAVFYSLQERGLVAIRTRDLSRTHRQRLCQNGFLQEVIKGWFIPTRPDEIKGESTAWYSSFWSFCSAYLEHRKGENWCLSPEQSLAIHAENWTVPTQLLVRARKARNNVTSFPYGTSLLDIRATLPAQKNRRVINGLRLFSIPAALIACGPQTFIQNPMNMRTALSMMTDASQVLELLLEGGHSTIAGRLAGAFRNIGRPQIADDIVNTMRSIGYSVREKDPFSSPISITFPEREKSPLANRIRLMWETMRNEVIEHFPIAPGQPNILKYT